MEQNFFRNLVILGLFVIILLLLLNFQTTQSNQRSQSNKNNYSPHEQELINPAKQNIKYMDGIDIIYWINLDRSIDRRNHMEKVFQDPVFQNIQIERMSAVDGKNPSIVYPKLNFMYKQKNDYEYACMLSHLETIRRFSRTNYEVALIMEDDITLEFKKYWRKSVREIMENAPPDWEIIQLCYNTNNNPNLFKLYERNTRNKTVCAAAYLIKNRAAKKIINDIYNDGKYNLEHYIIHHADCYIFNKTVTYTYKYPYFIYKTNNDSLLHPEDLKSHERSKIKVIEMYNNLTLSK
jgi:GR25 family glycosyltransferase involved in LPS biosynthesis